MSSLAVQVGAAGTLPKLYVVPALGPPTNLTSYGLLRSTSKLAALVSLAAVLPALSETGPDSTVRSLPSRVSVPTSKLAFVVSAKPEGESEAVHLLKASVMYQPLVPSGADFAPASVILGALPSRLILTSTGPALPPS